MLQAVLGVLDGSGVADCIGALGVVGREASSFVSSFSVKVGAAGGSSFTESVDSVIMSSLEVVDMTRAFRGKRGEKYRTEGETG